MERKLTETLAELIACAEAWMPGVRLLGNVRAGDMVEALYRARSAVEFVEKRGHHYADAVEIAGHVDLATHVRDEAAEILDEGVWAQQYLGTPVLDQVRTEKP